MPIPRFRVRTLMFFVASAAIGFAASPKTRVAGYILDGASPPLAIPVARPSCDVVTSAAAIAVGTCVVLVGLARLGDGVSRSRARRTRA